MCNFFFVNEDIFAWQNDFLIKFYQRFSRSKIRIYIWFLITLIFKRLLRTYDFSTSKKSINFYTNHYFHKIYLTHQKYECNGNGGQPVSSIYQCITPYKAASIKGRFFGIVTKACTHRYCWCHKILLMSLLCIHVCKKRKRYLVFSIIIFWKKLLTRKPEKTSSVLLHKKKMKKKLIFKKIMMKRYS